MTAEEFAQATADAVDRRREEVNLVLRVVAGQEGTVLEQTAAIMALPVLYAHWEGFVKETVSQYIEYIEMQRLHPRTTHPTIFSFAMRKRLKALIDSGSIERMTNFASWIVGTAVEPLRFADKKVVTGGNLSYNNLKELCDSLKIDVVHIESDRKKIDALVNRRNNIAHTGRPPRLDKNDVADDASLVIGLIEKFEVILRECVDANRFRSSDPA
ncbi:MAE_28990/MAE_18760 family HEPN-like nuclease [Methylobacterium sp. E-045]|uniref:MAE_28990/MAE_18760 family HEPN-like nuclease n=1 Tax=Methylobacterium sp. E-045 TaxID=2836575 RepID=UPI001FB8F727|nr:MAE_28990/MAE_18760 family HEPN-like nuclease [Methylobacterium sp. E-045]MCJ2129411.1 MAE_28990/MAE_18760 family HEPN-like nuclease [Methylobacterium sp. E-045]